MDVVKEVLEKQAKELEKYKTINVTKHEEVKIDLGHLMISDPNNFDEKQIKWVSFCVFNDSSFDFYILLGITQSSICWT